MNKKLIVIFTIAFLLRLISLNQSLWLDEATTAKVVQQFSYLGIVTKFSPFDFHPPLYYWLVKFWAGFFGHSEIALRMPSVIFSLLTGYVVYKIASLLHGYIAGEWAAIFFLFNPLIVYYSQEARPYMMVTFTLTAALYYLIKIIQSSPLRPAQRDSAGQAKLKTNLLLFNLFSVLSIFIFYGSIFFIIAIFTYLFFRKQFKFFFLSSIYHLASIILISPLLYQQLTNARISLAAATNWSMVLGKANLKNLLLIPLKFSIGRIDFYPKYLYYLIAGTWTIFIWAFIGKSLVKIIQSFPFLLRVGRSAGQAKLKADFLLIYLLFGTLLLGFVVSFFSPLLQYFRFIYLIPVMAIILALSIDATIIRIIVATGFFVFSMVYLCVSTFHREDWKSLVKNMGTVRTVYMIESSSDPVKYYNPKLKIKDLKKSTNPLSDRLYIIPYTAEIHGVDYKKTFSNMHYKLIKTVNFRDVSYEIWAI